MMSNQAQNMITKEISKGIFLHKQQLVSNDSDGSQLLYVFKVQVETLQILEFTADFSGSDNLELQGSKNLHATTTIDPFTTSIVAILKLFKNWKLKSRFKFTMKNPPKDFQLRHLHPKIKQIDDQIIKVHQALANFPVQTSTSGEIEHVLFKHNINFIDLDFPPIETSAYEQVVAPLIFSATIESPFDTIIHWRRPQEFMTVDPAQGLREPSIFYDSIEPNDIIQGALGDCWFMSALASLAERPALVERLFITKEVNPQGVYRVKLCKNGEWVVVTIDDYFPCYPDGGPIFSRAQGNELWVMLLEKAYAKLHSNYLLLRGGYAVEGMLDLTGCPTVSYYFQDQYVQELIKGGNLWRILKNYDDDGFLISASTPGEDRWTEYGGPDQDSNGLVPGHAYTIIIVKEIKGHQLVNIRNPWGNFEWNGDWCDSSPLWTQEMRKAAGNPELNNDGTFWMSYNDFLEHFTSINVCRVKNWEEVRIKGKFVRVQDIDDPDIEVVMSKWYYSLDITETTRIIIGLHQEDERIAGVLNRRPYLDIGIAVLKRVQNGVELIDIKDLVSERQCELDIELEPGTYIILPRTSGCMLRRPSFAEHESIRLMDHNKNFHPIVESTINVRRDRAQDIFRKFDMLLNRELTYNEFKGFYECINKTITEVEFKTQILDRYCSSNRGITLRGLKDFFRDAITKQGEETIWGWFENLGYDHDLYSIRSRCFILTLHSDSEMSVAVRDGIQTDLDNRTNVLIIERYGKQLEVKRGLRVLFTYSEQVHTYSYGVINDHHKTIEATIDTSGSKSMISSTKGAIVKKVGLIERQKVEPGFLEFMLHSQALPTEQTFVRSILCTWTEAK